MPELPELSMDQLREFLKGYQGKILSFDDMRKELGLVPGGKSWNNIRGQCKRLVEDKVLSSEGRKAGLFKVVKQVQPLRVFTPDRERRPPFELLYPMDQQKGMEIDIAENITHREGDLIVIGGVKSKSKTTLCMNFLAMNLPQKPVLMGNEYSVLVSREVDGHVEEYRDINPRFLARMDRMSEWVDWTDAGGYDRFTLLPVDEDYAEHVVKDRINIIDWIDLDSDRLYNIKEVLKGIKASLGRGIGIVALQKSETSSHARGGQMVRDFADVELLLDKFDKTEDNVLMTVKGVKEPKGPVVMKNYAYTVIEGGTQIWNFREVTQCPDCRGSGYTKGGECDRCIGSGWVDA